mmetsp:Transcript_61589/g.194906  ORF Transcript_61589/g.194906 Transcript_61589/m.194906 type:complete len:151 (+) Transcript_61589:3-455(+)
MTTMTTPTTTNASNGERLFTPSRARQPPSPGHGFAAEDAMERGESESDIVPLVSRFLTFSMLTTRTYYVFIIAAAFGIFAFPEYTDQALEVYDQMKVEILTGVVLIALWLMRMILTEQINSANEISSTRPEAVSKASDTKDTKDQVEGGM